VLNDRLENNVRRNGTHSKVSEAIKVSYITDITGWSKKVATTKL